MAQNITVTKLLQNPEKGFSGILSADKSHIFYFNPIDSSVKKYNLLSRKEVAPTSHESSFYLEIFNAHKNVIYSFSVQEDNDISYVITVSQSDIQKHNFSTCQHSPLLSTIPMNICLFPFVIFYNSSKAQLCYISETAVYTSSDHGATWNEKTTTGNEKFSWLPVKTGFAYAFNEKDGCLYVFGGVEDRKGEESFLVSSEYMLDNDGNGELWKLNVENLQWEKLDTVPQYKRFLSGMCFTGDHSIAILGGFESNNRFVDNFGPEEYSINPKEILLTCDLSTKSWTAVAIPTSQSNYSSNLYIFSSCQPQFFHDKQRNSLLVHSSQIIRNYWRAGRGCDIYYNEAVATEICL